VIAEFVKTADGEVGEKLCRHGSAHIIVVRQREARVSKKACRPTMLISRARFNRRARRAIGSSGLEARNGLGHFSREAIG
jgi:hypothetical protein